MELPAPEKEEFFQPTQQPDPAKAKSPAGPLSPGQVVEALQLLPANKCKARSPGPMRT